MDRQCARGMIAKLNIAEKIWSAKHMPKAYSILPLQFSFLGKFPIVYKAVSFVFFLSNRYLWMMFIYPAICIQIFSALISVLLKKKKLQNVRSTVLINASGMCFPTYKASGRKEELVIFNINEKRFSIPGEYSSCPTFTWADLLNCKDVFSIIAEIFQQARFLHHFQKKTGETWPVLQSFQWVLVKKALLKYTPLKTLVFCNVDNWSYLFAGMKDVHTVFMQHGIVNSSLLYYFKFKWLNINEIYCYNDEQFGFFSKIIHHIGEKHFFKPRITLVPVNTAKKTVLLVGCVTLYRDIEEKLIADIAGRKNLQLYVKPHPVFSKFFYQIMKKKHDFILIEEKDFFPDVDVVISYESTLAYQYEISGKTVYFHTREKIDCTII